MRRADRPLRYKRKRCLHCGDLFDPDRRTQKKQRYCCAIECQMIRQRRNENDWRVRHPDCLEYQQQRSREWHQKHPQYNQERRAEDPELVRRNRELTQKRMRRSRAKEAFDKSKLIVTQVAGNKGTYCYLSRGAGWLLMRLTKARSLIKRGCLGHNRSRFKCVENRQARLPVGRLYDLAGAFG